MKNKFELNEIVSFVDPETKETIVGKICSFKCTINTIPTYKISILKNENPKYKDAVCIIDEDKLSEVPKYCIVIRDVSNKYFVVKNGVKISKAEDSLENAVKNAYREDYKFETLYSKVANDYNNIVNSIFVYQLCDIYLIQFTKDLKYFVKKEEVLTKTNFKIKQEVKKSKARKKK